ncbi:MAG: hypothetical protein ACOYKQ_13510 [Polymorphobacter sp.]
MAIFLKDPTAMIDFAIDWSANVPADRTLVESTWAVMPGGSESVVVTASVREALRSVATLGGGQQGQLYHVTNRVIFSDGRSDERTLVLRVENQ